MPPRFPRVRFNTPADFKAFHSEGNKGLMFRVEFLQQDLRESNADLLYVTAIALERIYFNPRAGKIAKGRKNIQNLELTQTRAAGTARIHNLVDLTLSS